jgi:arylsulfatase A-like enzyme
MPDKPFFAYFAPGATHAPHHVSPEWADKYKGAFDDGWDALRERIFAKQKELGVIPADAELTRRLEAHREAGQPASGSSSTRWNASFTRKAFLISFTVPP